jgi:hypothetical protein
VRIYIRGHFRHSYLLPSFSFSTRNRPKRANSPTSWGSVVAAVRAVKGGIWLQQEQLEQEEQEGQELGQAGAEEEE